MTETLRFVDLFAGLGGFHRALEGNHHCVFASEINPKLRSAYQANFGHRMDRGAIVGDIREHVPDVPPHDILCAGFPCQPFSKSGGQLGTADSTRGTLFHEIIRILERRRPSYIILENVGNFPRHDKGRTWRIVRERLESLGYHVAGTEHVTAPPRSDWRDRGGQDSKKPAPSSRTKAKGGYGLLSPHHFGRPHHRERFFVVASRQDLPEPAFPIRDKKPTSLDTIVQEALSTEDRRETALSGQQKRCIEHWNQLVQVLPESLEPPSFPLWGDELEARYPFESRTPWATPPRILRNLVNGHKFPPYTRREVLLSYLPSYAREQVPQFRQWKIHFIAQNRAWWKQAAPHLPLGWAKELRKFPASLRKLEWNVKGEERDLWAHVLQFRPSGLRVKRYTSSPALVAMTATQIPILGPQRRFLTRLEGKRLQDFPDDHILPASRSDCFEALGNAVHVGLVRRIADQLLHGKRARLMPLAQFARP